MSKSWNILWIGASALCLSGCIDLLLVPRESANPLDQPLPVAEAQPPAWDQPWSDGEGDLAVQQASLSGDYAGVILDEGTPASVSAYGVAGYANVAVLSPVSDRMSMAILDIMTELEPGTFTASAEDWDAPVMVMGCAGSSPDTMFDERMADEVTVTVESHPARLGAYIVHFDALFGAYESHQTHLRGRFDLVF